MDALITCNRCQRALSASAFYVRRQGARAGQIRHPCKDCTRATDNRYFIAHREKTREYQRTWVASNRERMALLVRRSELRRQYGISLEEYTTLLEQQGGVCAICGRPETAPQAKYLAVDHCHKTGKVRGLLRRSCNAAIGVLDDDPVLIGAALRYLERAEADG